VPFRHQAIFWSNVLNYYQRTHASPARKGLNQGDLHWVFTVQWQWNRSDQGPNLRKHFGGYLSNFLTIFGVWSPPSLRFCTISGALFGISGANSPAAPVYFGPCCEVIMDLCLWLQIWTWRFRYRSRLCKRIASGLSRYYNVSIGIVTYVNP